MGRVQSRTAKSHGEWRVERSLTRLAALAVWAEGRPEEARLARLWMRKKYPGTAQKKNNEEYPATYRM